MKAWTNFLKYFYIITLQVLQRKSNILVGDISTIFQYKQMQKYRWK